MKEKNILTVELTKKKNIYGSFYSILGILNSDHDYHRSFDNNIFEHRGRTYHRAVR